MSTRSKLLSEIHDFVSETGIPEGRLGRLSINDPGLVNRLKNGGGLTIANLDRVRDFMHKERERLAKANQGAAA